MIKIHMAVLRRSRFSALSVCAAGVALACMTCGAAWAQAPFGTLKEVVVSGSRNEAVRDDLPLSMDVVTPTDLEQKQIVDIKDLVADLPNVSVKHAPARFGVAGRPNTTGRDGNAGFNIRGLGGNRVLMLVDGIRLPRSYVNGNSAFGRDTISLDLLKRIELVRGPSSVLYGSDGIAGLVNFITYEPSDFLTGTGAESKNLGGRVAAGWSGDDDGLRVATTVAGRASETVQWMLTGTTQTANGLHTLGSNDAANVTRTTANPQTNRNDSLLAKLVIQPDASQKHVLTLEHVDKKSDTELLSSRAKPPLTVSSSTVLSENANQDQRRDRLTWDARYQPRMAWADQLQTVVSLQNSDAQDNGQTIVNTAPNALRTRNTLYSEHARQASVQASKTLPISADWTARNTYGLDLASTDITSWFGGADAAPLPAYVPKKYFPDSRDSTAALYAQSELGSERWSVTPGVRLERFVLDVTSLDGYGQPATSLSGTQWTPKIGTVFRAAPEWSVFANYATGFRAPNATQLNGFSESTSSGYATYLSNPDLKPETSKNIEFGVRGRMDRLTVDVAAFTGDYNQLIVDKKLLSGNPAACGALAPGCVYQSVNVDNATIWGFELSGNMDWGYWAGGRWSTPFAYGQTRGRDNGTGRPLNSIDPALLALGLGYANGTWSVRVDWRYHAAKNASDVDPTAGLSSGTQYADMPEATTLDVSGQWRIRKDVRLTAAIINLTDRKYWLWSDVQGLTTASAATLIDAYSQPGRHVNLSLVVDF